MLKIFPECLTCSRHGIGVGLISSMGGRGKKTVAGYRSVYLFVSLESMRTSHCHLWEHQFFCVMIIFSHTPISRTSRYLLFAGNEDFRYFTCGAVSDVFPLRDLTRGFSSFYACERDLVLFIIPIKPNPKHALAKKILL